jgi:hypothetical protein
MKGRMDMANKSLSRVLPAVLLLGCESVFAQLSISPELGRELRENDVPVRQGLASDGTQLHENMEALPVRGAISGVSFQGRLQHSGTNEIRPDADSVDALYRNRVMCEHRRDNATAWRCKPHARQR